MGRERGHQWSLADGVLGAQNVAADDVNIALNLNFFFEEDGLCKRMARKSSIPHWSWTRD